MKRLRMTAESFTTHVLAVAADRWHEGRGYNLNRQAMAAIVLDEEDGPTNFVVSARQNRSTVGFNIKNRSRAA